MADRRRLAEGSRDDWETPPSLFALLDEEFHFTLDAAASQANRKCARYLTVEEDALKADVMDHVVWCNPPYGRGLLEWVKAFARWAILGRCTVVALLPAGATDTAWFEHVWNYAHEIRFLRGRVQFIGSGRANPVGSMVAIYRPLLMWSHAPAQAPLGSVEVSFVPPRVLVWRWRG